MFNWKNVAARFLGRAGGLLAITAAILTCIWVLIELRTVRGTGADRATKGVITSSVARPAERSKGVIEGGIQVVAAETQSLSREDWLRTLSGLSKELRLGLSVEVSLPSTTSSQPPPADGLSRLLWAREVLRHCGIELKVEHGTLRVLSLPPPVDSPLEASLQKYSRSHPWEPLEMPELQASPEGNREVSLIAQAS
jgi:hypothetical protein